MWDCQRHLFDIPNIPYARWRSKTVLSKSFLWQQKQKMSATSKVKRCTTGTLLTTGVKGIVCFRHDFCLRLLPIASDAISIVSCETNLRQSGEIGANRVKKSRRVRGVSPDSTTQNLCLIPFKSDQQHF